MSRAFDATPWFTEFASLHPEVCEHARFLVRSEDDPSRWKAVPTKEFRRLCPKSRLPGRGIWELLAQRASASSVFANGEVDHAEYPVAPCFLQDGRASTMYDAVDKAVDHIGYSQLGDLAKTVKYVILCQVPDAAKANSRLMTFAHNHLQPFNNLLEHPLTACCVHTEHRVMVTAVEEESIIGDCHANAVIHRSSHQHNSVLAALEKVLQDESQFEYNLDMLPHPEWSVHLREVLSFTVLADVRWSTGADGVALHDWQEGFGVSGAQL